MSFMNPYTELIEGYPDILLREAILEDEDLLLLYDIADIYQQRLINNMARSPLHDAPIETAQGLAAFLDTMEVDSFLDNSYAFFPMYPQSYQPADISQRQGLLYSLPQIQTLEVFKKLAEDIYHENYSYNRYPTLDDGIMQSILTDSYHVQTSITHNRPFRLNTEYSTDLSQAHPILTHVNIVTAISELRQSEAIMMKMDNVARATLHELKKFIEEQQEYRFSDPHALDLIRWNIRSSVELAGDVTEEKLAEIGRAYYHQGQVMRTAPYPTNSPRRNFDKYLLRSLQDEFEMNAYVLFASNHDKSPYIQSHGSLHHSHDFQENFLNKLDESSRKYLRSVFSQNLAEITEPIRNGQIPVYPVLAP